MKTQAISVNLATRQLSPSQLKTKTAQIQEQVSPSPSSLIRTVHLKMKEDVKEIKQATKKIENINTFAYTFPDFYKKELKNAFVICISWLCIALLSYIGISLAIWQICVHPDVSKWLIVLLTIPFILISALAIVYLDKYLNFRREAKTISFKENKTVSIHIQKLYKRLKTGHINVNWMSGIAYSLSTLIFLFTALIFWIMFKNSAVTSGYSVGDWFVPIKYAQSTGDATFAILSITCLTVFVSTLVLQSLLLITNYIRINRIDCFYGVQIVTQEEIDIIKKKKNRRDLFIFLAVVVLLFLICFLVYKIIKKRKATTTNVVVKS